MFNNIYKDKRVLVTGHTGFKGSWLTTWLLHLGAEVAGYALAPPSTPSNFEVLQLARHIQHHEGDVRDRDGLNRVIHTFKPEIILHLAAQALVRKSYTDPVETFETNTLGTLNVLECIRQSAFVEAAVMITSDKCYRNVEWVWGYRENDRLGGEDPYSGSKGAAELVCYSYISSYFNDPAKGPCVATARAGNVIGGGDWADDRIIPDCVRSWSAGETVSIRSPKATRPWQHVLEPLSGYLSLGEHLLKRDVRVVSQAYNFGPDANVNQPVEELIRRISMYWPQARWAIDPAAARNQPEATLLKLSCDKALADLKWHATLSFDDTVRMTSQWYQAFYGAREDMRRFTDTQIKEYSEKAVAQGLPWTTS